MVDSRAPPLDRQGVAHLDKRLHARALTLSSRQKQFKSNFNYFAPETPWQILKGFNLSFGWTAQCASGRSFYSPTCLIAPGAFSRLCVCFLLAAGRSRA